MDMYGIAFYFWEKNVGKHCHGEWKPRNPNLISTNEHHACLRVAFLGIEMWKKISGEWHLTLNNAVRPIENKYCEGKLK